MNVIQRELRASAVCVIPRFVNMCNGGIKCLFSLDWRLTSEEVFSRSCLTLCFTYNSYQHRSLNIVIQRNYTCSLEQCDCYALEYQQMITSTFTCEYQLLLASISVLIADAYCVHRMRDLFIVPFVLAMSSIPFTTEVWIKDLENYMTSRHSWAVYPGLIIV